MKPSPGTSLRRRTFSRAGVQTMWTQRR
ncbi:hypothetical protein GQ600_14024 [Phytophthora cactorum]|nr:hypothetical protein GQ600_14024 [Phytophthora cactorum]